MHDVLYFFLSLIQLIDTCFFFLLLRIRTMITVSLFDKDHRENKNLSQMRQTRLILSLKSTSIVQSAMW